MAATTGLRFTDGTTTVTISDGTTGWLIDYQPKSKAAGEYAITERATTMLIGTLATVRGLVQSLNILFRQAETWENERLAPIVYVERQLDTTEIWYRSPVVEGLATLSANALDMDIINQKVETDITFTRRNYWEGAEAQISLTNHITTTTTSAVTVFNPDVYYQAATISFNSGAKKILDSANGLVNFKTGDTIKVGGSTSNDGVYTVATGGVAAEIVTTEAIPLDEIAGDTVTIQGAACNYVDVPISTVVGDIPGATRIEMLNSWNNANGLWMLWIGQNHTTPATFTHILQAEAATGTTDTEDVGGGSSGGYYVAKTLASGTEADLFVWPISAAQLSYAAGRWFKVLMRMKAPADSRSAKYRILLRYASTTLWQSGLVALDTNYHIAIRDIGVFQLPPTLGGQATLAALEFVIRGYQSTGATITISLDYVQLTPVDGYRYLGATGPEMEYNRRLVDDGITGIVYEDNGAGSAKLPNWIGYSTPIMLKPAVAQRIYFVQGGGTADTSEINRTLAVKVHYRPRSLTI